MAEEKHKLKNMRAIRSEGVLYVAEKDCRDNVAEALAQKKPLLEKIATLVAALEFYDGHYDGGKVARAALEKAKP